MADGGVVAGSIYADFVDHVGGGNERRFAAIGVVGDAVNVVIDAAEAGAADADGAGLIDVPGTVVGKRGKGRAGGEGIEPGDGAGTDGHVGENLAIDDLADGRVSGFKDGRFGADFNFLGGGAGFKGDIDAEAVADSEFDIRAGEGFEAGECGGDGVFAGGEIVGFVDALVIRSGTKDDAGADLVEGDGSVGNDGAGGVRDGSVNETAGVLGR